MPSTLALQAPLCVCTHAFTNHFGPLRTSARPPKGGRCKQCSGCSGYTSTDPAAGGLKQLANIIKPDPTPSSTVSPAVDALRFPTKTPANDDEFMAALGLGRGARKTLRCILDRDGITTDQLCAAVGITQSGLSLCVSRLMEQDLIEVRLRKAGSGRAMKRTHHANRLAIKQRIQDRIESLEAVLGAL